MGCTSFPEDLCIEPGSPALQVDSLPTKPHTHTNRSTRKSKRNTVTTKEMLIPERYEADRISITRCTFKNLYLIINICLTDQTDKAVNDKAEHPTQAEEDGDIRVGEKKKNIYIYSRKKK